MRTSSAFVMFCLAVGIAPSFALPLEVSPDPVLHTRGASFSSRKKGQTEEPHSSKPPSSGRPQWNYERTPYQLSDYDQKPNRQGEPTYDPWEIFHDLYIKLHSATKS
ncbi:hypothetical protein F5148DRAFT_1174584 [Russula earlei]|uniref:Uncharacterized protein n=1 Tax=Russula earlei TaxID=71964 RepID=A0ACC0UIR6_9AGAM|nr:hypothetical protein F5148DRAFT_1174584 [Russula earlei]